jgi:hypothetical protein
MLCTKIYFASINNYLYWLRANIVCLSFTKTTPARIGEPFLDIARNAMIVHHSQKTMK